MFKMKFHNVRRKKERKSKRKKDAEKKNRKIKSCCQGVGSTSLEHKLWGRGQVKPEDLDEIKSKKNN